MNRKLKALGFGVLVMVAVAALSGASATATGGGHFVLGAEHTTVEALRNTQHSFTFKAHSGLVTCETFRHEGTIVAAQVATIDLAPSYTGCLTNGGTSITAYTYNECVYRLAVAKNTTSTTEQTMQVLCPAGKVLEFHQPNCLATMPSQTAVNAATYTTTEVNGKHAITADVHATFETQYHGGICIFLGTKQSVTMQGSPTLIGFNTSGESVSITAT